MLQSRNCHGRVLQMGYWIYYIDIRHTVSIGFIPNELKLEFPIRLENPHVIPEDQIWAGVVPVGPSGYPFNSSYRSRNSIQYKIDLGNAIVNFARIVPDGLLVFFASHCFLDQCVGCWKSMVKYYHIYANNDVYFFYFWCFSGLHCQILYRITETTQVLVQFGKEYANTSYLLWNQDNLLSFLQQLK
ncbi:unnamed protein product [Cuscuta europaea]|uniref:Uncharacterized protein n=1 Tax=Cuscuta europaea TaxID=41803 RepID=A0A9P0YPY6_CUSEU|nr:unnamed protein product [Cuscuta europaea]